MHWAMHIREVFEEQNITIIPSIFASLHPNGMIERDAYERIATTILQTIKDNISDIDGLYLQLHMASGVVSLEGISGEHDLITRIRAIVGKYMPIAVVNDPHGNITEDFTKHVNIVHCKNHLIVIK
jgi:microcystin degradation protein MlrC